MLSLGPAYRGTPRGATAGFLLSGCILLAWLLDLGFWRAVASKSATKPEIKKGPVTVLHLTDFHLFADTEEVNKGVRPYHSLREVLKSAHQRHPAPDALLLTGDFTNDNTRGSYDNAVRAVRSFWPPAVPVLYVPGNHEDLEVLHGSLGSSKGWYGPAPANGFGTVGIDVSEKWRAVLLNTHAGGDAVEGRLPEEAVAALRRELGRAAAGGRKVLLALHHPPVPPNGPDAPPWGRNCLVDPEPLLHAVEDHPGVVGIAVHGHLHTELGREGGGVEWLVTPATCHQLQTSSDEWGEWEVDKGSAPGWRRIVLGADGVATTGVHRVRLSTTAEPGGDD